jgi:3-carboxy-cis,cis-muconate cycloisomerase
MSLLFQPLFTTPAMAEALSDRVRLQAMLDFEAALARGSARAGLVPPAAAAVISGRCRASLFDLGALGAGAAQAGNPAIPMVKALTALVAAEDPSAAGFVHAGATSQDAMDTGLVLQLRTALGLVAGDLSRLSAALARLAEAHRGTVQSGRTWLQPAAPITFGLKVAGWLSAVERHRQRLDELLPRLLVLQLGGAVGTLAAFGPAALAVAEGTAAELQLSVPDLPWHAHRDRLAEVATALGLLTGTLGKVARDLSLLAQGEVAEAAEPPAPGRGGSSAMPQKENPVGAAVALAAAVRVPGLVSVMLGAMVQEHERGLGGWQAEWETLPEICALAAGALGEVTPAAEGMVVRPERMAANLEASAGLVHAGAVADALSGAVGRTAAHALVAAAAARARAEGRHLRQVLAEDPQVGAHLSASRLAGIFEDAGTGIAGALVDRALAGRAARGRKP